LPEAIADAIAYVESKTGLLIGEAYDSGKRLYSDFTIRGACGYHVIW